LWSHSCLPVFFHKKCVVLMLLVIVVLCSRIYFSSDRHYERVTALLEYCDCTLVTCSWFCIINCWFQISYTVTIIYLQCASFQLIPLCSLCGMLVNSFIWKPILYKFSKYIIFVVFTVELLSAKFSSSKFIDWLLTQQKVWNEKCTVTGMFG